MTRAPALRQPKALPSVALASTPYNVAVGGTAFNEGGNDSRYWSSANDAHQASALSYIPETTWNESGTTSTGISLAAGYGGVSSVFSTPIWQTGQRRAFE